MLEPIPDGVISIAASSVPLVEWERDLIYVDQPWLSVMRNQDGQPFIRHWCDAAEGIFRWWMFQTTDAKLGRYESGQIGLRTFFFQGSVASISYLFNTNRDLVPQEAWLLLSPAQLNDEYVPQQDALHTSSLARSPRGRQLLLATAGDWTFEDIGDTARALADAYYFTAQAIDSQNVPVAGVLKDGFSHHNLYKAMRKRQGPAFGLGGVYMNSPGYIKFNGNPEWLERILAVATSFWTFDDDHPALYKELERFFAQFARKHGENAHKKPAPEAEMMATSILQALHPEDLNLGEGVYRWLDSQHDQSAHLHYTYAKLVMAHYRRIERIAKMIKNGKIVPPAP